ncbi:hypothetical protein BGZ93_011207 [Podila epicladia]|nr:hypothetical protein BGZ93_011207 [Podila epicladia]
MSSILNVLRQAPTPTRHFTSLHVVASTKVPSSSSAFNPEHHPIVLQQLVESLSPSAYVSNSTTQLSPSSLGAQSLSSSSADALLAAARESLSEIEPQQAAGKN